MFQSNNSTDITGLSGYNPVLIQYEQSVNVELSCSYNTIQYNAVQYNTEQCNTRQGNTI